MSQFTRSWLCNSLQRNDTLNFIHSIKQNNSNGQVYISWNIDMYIIYDMYIFLLIAPIVVLLACSVVKKKFSLMFNIIDLLN